MKEKCKCGKMAVYLYRPNDGKQEPYLCEDCVPPVVNDYLLSEEGFLYWQKSNPLRDGNNEATDGI